MDVSKSQKVPVSFIFLSFKEFPHQVLIWDKQSWVDWWSLRDLRGEHRVSKSYLGFLNGGYLAHLLQHLLRLLDSALESWRKRYVYLLESSISWLWGNRLLGIKFRLWDLILFQRMPIQFDRGLQLLGDVFYFLVRSYLIKLLKCAFRSFAIWSIHNNWGCFNRPSSRATRALTKLLHLNLIFSIRLVLDLLVWTCIHLGISVVSHEIVLMRLQHVWVSFAIW